MTPLNSAEITALVSAVTDPVSTNLVAILTILATVGGLYLIVKFVKRGVR